MPHLVLAEVVGPHTDYTVVGLLTTAVITLAGVIAAVSRIVYRRLLSKEEGLLTIIVDKHVEFVQSTASTNASIVENTEQTAMAVRDLKDGLLSFHSQYLNSDDYSTVATNDALLEFVFIAEEIVNDELTPERRRSAVLSHTSKVREILHRKLRESE